MRTGRVRRWIVPAVVLAVSIATARCASVRTSPGSERIYGTWEWIGSVGGIGGFRITPESVPLDIRYRFDEDRSLEVIRDGSVAERTGFSVVERPGRAGAPPQTVVRYGEAINVFPPPQREQYVRFQGLDTLRLGDMCADCFEHAFVRVRP